MVTVDEVIQIHKKICMDAQNLISKKGRMYCGVQQKSGDTLHSRRIQEFLGIVDYSSFYSLGRAAEKLQRLVSLMKQNLDPQEESIEDSVRDLINDVIFAFILYQENNNIKRKLNKKKKLNKKSKKEIK